MWVYYTRLGVSQLQTGTFLGIQLFAAKLRELRESADLSRRELAERMNSHLNTITNWERAILTPGSVELALICRELAVPCEVFTTILLAPDPAAPPEPPKSKRRRPPPLVRKRQPRPPS